MDIQKNVCDFLLENDGIAKLFNLEVVELDQSHSKVRLQFKDEYKNAVGILHGGAIFALCDFAYAIASACNGDVKLNVSSHIAFLQAGKVGPFIAECTELNAGHKISNFEVKVYDGDGQMIAICQITGYTKSKINVVNE